MTSASTRVTMFGLDVWADRSLPFLAGATAVPTGRDLQLSLSSASTAADWPADATRISDERTAQGDVVFQIDRAEIGYRISGPRYGTTILSPEGLRVRGSTGSGGVADWQRLLVAQVLPFVAILRGLEVLHASAVAVGGEAVAFLGPSGAGKTSVAAALCRLGAGFLADDVLSVERDGGRLLGHPGAPVSGIDRDEVERLRSRDCFDQSLVVAESPREAMVRMTPHPTPVPLKAIFLLDRRPDGPAQPRFEPVVEPRVLLAATFNLVVLEQARLEALLDVCAIAAGGRVERVVLGPGTDASVLAAELGQRIGIGR